MALSQAWKDTVNDGLSNKAWDDYDALIKAELGACGPSQGTPTTYNPRFKICIDGKFIKAMLWVESGGPKNTAWKSRPFQIGNPGDSAYRVLKAGSEGSKLIMSAALFSDIKTKKIDEPTLNVRAGIAYLLTRMAKFETRSVLDARDTSIHLVKVQRGDSLDAIARRVGTTREVLEGFLKQSTKPLQVGQELQYRKASMMTVIASWRSWNTKTLAARYNGGGDATYAEKLDYVLALFPKLQR